MKILFISSGNSLKGLSPIVLSQGESLKKSDRITSLDYFVIKGKGIKGYLSSVPKLKKYLEKRDFDIIHAHYSLSAIVASLAGAKPLVVSLMGSDVKAKSWNKLMIYFFYNFSWSGTIVKSEDMKKSLGFKGIKVIPNGIDFDVFYPMEKQECQSKLRWNMNKKHILFPSNPDRPEKNYSLLDQALSYLEESNIELHTLVDVPHKDVPFYLNASDVIVLTSLWEGSPNAIKETLACNRPVVSTDVGDISWLFNKVEGCYISDFTKNKLAEKIQKALKFSKEANQTNGRDRLLSLNLSSDRVAEELVRVYKSILDK